MEAINKCGDCQVCCVLPKIKELNKPAFVHCERLCEDGCSLYTDRPKVCRSFNCTWLLSNWSEDLRPDKLGMMFYSTKDGLKGAELKQFAYANSKKIQDFTARLAAKTDLTIQLYPR